MASDIQSETKTSPQANSHRSLNITNADPNSFGIMANFLSIVDFINLIEASKTLNQKAHHALYWENMIKRFNKNHWPTMLKQAAEKGYIDLVKCLCKYVYVTQSVLEAAVASGNYNLVGWLVTSKKVQPAETWKSSDKLDEAVAKLIPKIRIPMQEKLIRPRLLIHDTKSLSTFKTKLIADFNDINNSTYYMALFVIFSGPIVASFLSYIFFAGLALLVQGLIALKSFIVNKNKLNQSLLTLYTIGIPLVFLLSLLPTVSLSMGLAVLVSLVALLQLIDIVYTFYNKRFQEFRDGRFTTILFLIFFTFAVSSATANNLFTPYFGFAGWVAGIIIAAIGGLTIVAVAYRSIQLSKIKIPADLLIRQPAKPASADSAMDQQPEPETLNIELTAILPAPKLSNPSEVKGSKPAPDLQNFATESKTDTPNAPPREHKSDSPSVFFPPPGDSKRNTATANLTANPPTNSSAPSHPGFFGEAPPSTTNPSDPPLTPVAASQTGPEPASATNTNP